MVDDDLLATDSNADTPSADSAAKAMAILSKAKAKKEAKETDNGQEVESKDNGGSDAPSEVCSRVPSRVRLSWLLWSMSVIAVSSVLLCTWSCRLENHDRGRVPVGPKRAKR